jgi:hypothetical protein
MPYMIVRRPSSDTYGVKTMATGHIHGWTTLKNAEAQKRVLEALLEKGRTS